jgi:hypothetical protein
MQKENKPGLTREFFATKNGTCLGEPTDSFDLPLGVCVGPFGKPRPWGVFECQEEKGADSSAPGLSRR